jgi:hypothetical protein
MINLSNVSLVTIDGVGNDKDAIKALKYSTRGINFKSVMYITAGDLRPNFCDIVNISKMSWNDYNCFCLKTLCDYIDSDYIVLIQSDGFIVNPEKWSNSFLEYDYIGGPWPAENLSCNLPRWPIVMNEVQKNGIVYQVGNGGFTLRSKNLLNATKFLFKDEHYGLPEDVCISLLYRNTLENMGLKYPSVDEAGKFSCEAKHVNGKKFSSDESFGFHCRVTHADKMTLLSTINIEEVLL